MTSQLNVDTIVDKAGSGGTNVKIGNTSTYVSDGGSATQNTVQGLIKQWSSFDQRGTTYGSNTAGDTFNTSSQADESTANVTVSFTNNMNNTTYNVQNSPHYDRTSSNKNYPRMGAGAVVTTSSYLSTSAHGNGSVDDTLHNSMAAGDLA